MCSACRGRCFAEGTVELEGSVNLLKGAIETADCLTTVSPAYAGEISAPGAAGPIASVIASHRIYGIRNGIPEGRQSRRKSADPSAL
uniref:starch synthase n=1 Tax=uncultured Rhizobium sp. TaxID=155567 RepID=A0A060CHP6_9HYPH|nr:CAZy families GT5 protein [uncultured Rhizobium sp.]